jgi:hypothetical protein
MTWNERARRACAAAAMVLALPLGAAQCSADALVSPPDGENVLDLTRFQQDRAAIGGKWYDYDAETHLLTPKPVQWLVRTPDDRVYGMRIVSVYDDEGESGLFNLDVFTYNGADFGASQRIVAPDNVKLRSPVCILLSDGLEVPCNTSHDVRFALQARLSTVAALTVDEPALFVGEGVEIAQMPQRTTWPAPGEITSLTDVPAAFDSTDWDFAQFSLNQPDAGLALGSLRVPQDGEVIAPQPRVHANDIWFMVTHDVSLLRLSWQRDVDNNTLVVRMRSQPLDRATLVVGAFGEERELVIPHADETQWIDFSADDGLVDGERAASAIHPTTPPPARLYDLAWVKNDDGSERLYLSTAAAVFNATALGVSEDEPPMTGPGSAQ